MSIKKYGLDAAEIEALEAQGKTDEEINAANAQRVREQIAADAAGQETEIVNGIVCLKGTDIPVDSIGAEILGKGEDADDGGEPILTNNEYAILEADILRKNNLVEPEIPEDDASPDELEKWHKAMRAHVQKKIELCADIRRRRQLGCYKVSNGEAEGDSSLPFSWSLELMYLND